MESLGFKASEVAYHLERLSHSKTAREAVDEKDQESFKKICQKLTVPEKYLSSILQIVFSAEPDQTWPWG